MIGKNDTANPSGTSKKKGICRITVSDATYTLVKNSTEKRRNVNASDSGAPTHWLFVIIINEIRENDMTIRTWISLLVVGVH